MKQKGIVLGFLTAMISGVSVFSNALFVSKTDPLVFAIIRNILVALMLTAFLSAAGRLRAIRTLTRKQWGQLVAIGAIGGGIPFALFFTGLSQIGAVNGNILNKTLFLWVAVLAVPILKERLAWAQIVGYIAVFSALFVFGGTFRFVPAVGSYLVLGATVLWAIEHVLAKITLRSVPSGIVAWGRMVFGLPFLLLAAAVMHKTGLFFSPASYTPAPLMMSSILLVGYVTTWYAALSQAPVTLVSSILVVAPVVTAVLSYGFFGKAMSQQQLIANIVIVLGITLIAATGTRWFKKEAAVVDHP